jgi:IS30 family transposase
MPVRGHVRPGRGPASCSSMPSCAPSSRNVWPWTGRRSRSQPGYAARTPHDPIGISVTRPSYQGLYAPGVSGLSRTLAARLRTGRPLRRRRRTPLARTPRYRVPSRLINERSSQATSRLRVGDWEGDLIFGRKGRSAIATLVDRRSRLVRLVHLPRGHGALEVRDALKAVFEAMTAEERRTLTWDQGPEMAAHDGIDELFDEGVYFAHPGAPWQRGSNENTNGLLRQYFPKGSDLSLHSAQALLAVEELLNHRPRKLLGWHTPARVHQDAIALRNG